MSQNSIVNDIEANNYPGLTIQTKQPERKSECFSLIGICSLLLLCLGLIGAVIAYYVFGIKFLVEDKDKNDECNSNIWTYVLTSIIISFVLGSSQVKSSQKSNEDKIFYNILIGLIWLGIGIWGLIEYESENCDELEKTNLYKFTYVISIFQTIIGGITFLVVTLFFCLGICCRENINSVSQM